MALKKLDYSRFSDSELAAQMMPRQAVLDADTWIAGDEQLTAELQRRTTVLHSRRYGPAPRQVADLYPAAQPGGPLLVFIHGGYWRGLSKDVFGYVAGPLQERGISVVVPNYDLCPTITLTKLVSEIADCLRWSHEQAHHFGADPARLHIAGNSAGAHLCAMMLSHDWAAEGRPYDLIKSAALITGIYDLTPIPRLPVQEEVRLQDSEITALSPLFLPLRSTARCLIAVGGDEPLLWIAQSQAYYDKLRRDGRAAELMILPESHHFSITRTLADGDSALAQLLLNLVLHTA